MKEDKIFTYEEFENVIKRFEEKKIKYFVFGGFSIDAINQEETIHEDLDLIILNSDKTKLIEILQNLGYSMKKLGRMMIFTKINLKQIYEVGVLIMKEFKKYYKIRGNWHEDTISKDAFEKENYLRIKENKFRIMPFEWFSLYTNIKHEIPEKEDRRARAMNKAKYLSKKIKILNGREIRRLKSDPKFNSG